MSLRSSTLLAAAALAPIPAWAQAVAGASLVVELRHEVLVEHARITLADVAVVHAGHAQAQELGAIPLGRAPRIGQMERLSRVQLEQAIRRHALISTPLAWEGAASVVVRTRAQMMPGRDVKDAAIMAIKPQFAGHGGTLSVDLAVPLPDLEVPVGVAVARARPVPPIRHGGRAPVWVDLFVDGEVYRSVVVQLSVSVRRQAYVALHAIAPGDMASATDFTLLDTDVSNGPVVGAEQTLQPFRAARAIRSGQPLTPGALLASGNVLRGDAVRVQMRSGQIGIETSGVAMTDGQPGQPLSVRTAGGRELVTGRVSLSGAVVIE